MTPSERESDIKERRLDILKSAAWILQKHQGHGDGWFKPMHIGGTDASHHSNDLKALCKKGLMERKLWGRAYAYRITEAGCAALSRRPA